MIFGKRQSRALLGGLIKRDPRLFIYCALTLLALIKFYDWADPPQVLATPGCHAGYVIDGDTIEIFCDGVRDRGRMIGLDAPELSKPQCASEKRAAEAARQALIAMMAAAQEVKVQTRGRDKYRRSLIYLWLDGEDAALRLIAAGHARAYDGGKRRGWCDDAR